MQGRSCSKKVDLAEKNIKWQKIETLYSFKLIFVTLTFFQTDNIYHI